MDNKQSLDPHMLNYFMEELEASFSIDQVQQAYQLLSHHFVQYNESYLGAVSAKMEGPSGRGFDIELDADFFGISTCSCQNSGYCEHMAATILHLYAQQGGRLERYMKARLDQHRQTEQKSIEQQRKSEQRKYMSLVNTVFDPNLGHGYGYHSSPVVGHHKSSKSSRMLQGNSSPDAWKRYFDDAMLKQAPRSEEDILELMLTLDECLEVSADWNVDEDLLFELSMYLYFLLILERYFAHSYDRRNYGYTITPSHRALNESFEAIERCISELDCEYVAEHCPDHVRALINVFHGDVLKRLTTSSIDWCYIYRLLWSNLWVRHEWREAEQQRLQQHVHALEAKGSADKELGQAALALAHFEIMNSNLEAAHKLLEPYRNTTKPSSFFEYLYDCFNQQSWDTLKTWLHWLKPMMEDAVDEDFSMYIEYWLGLDGKKPCEAELRHTLRELLPRSLDEYIEYLRYKGDIKMWVDVTLTMGLTFTQWDHFQWYLDDMAKDPRCVPLYHHFIMRSIERKNRGAYRDAVKALQALRMIYKTQKNIQQWELYLAKLKERYARLRALQEELLKGNIV